MSLERIDSAPTVDQLLSAAADSAAREQPGAVLSYVIMSADGATVRGGFIDPSRSRRAEFDPDLKRLR